MKDRDDEKGVSLRSKDAVEGGGIFGPGPATWKKGRFEMFEYKPKAGSKKRTVRAPAFVVRFERDGEVEKVPYGVGSGWAIGKDGLSLIPRQNQTGLPNNCNCFYLFESMEDAGMPDSVYSDITQLDNLDVVLVGKPIERTFEDHTSKKTVLLVGEFAGETPWGGGGKKKKKDDSEDGDDEKPKSKSKSKSDDEDDDDDKSKSKSNGKGKKEEDSVDDEAIEALIDLLGEDSPIKLDELEKAIRKSLKGNDNADVIAARCVEDDFLELEKGWTVNTKKGTVALD